MEAPYAIKVLGALAQETRLAIYRLLAQQESAGLAAGRIGEALSLAPATLSFHLRELAQAGLIRSRQQSRFVYYRADATAMKDVLAYLVDLAYLTEPCRESVAASRAPAPILTSMAPIAKPVVRPKSRLA